MKICNLVKRELSDIPGFKEDTFLRLFLTNEANASLVKNNRTKCSLTILSELFVYSTKM